MIALDGYTLKLETPTSMVGALFDRKVEVSDGELLNLLVITKGIFETGIDPEDSNAVNKKEKEE